MSLQSCPTLCDIHGLQPARLFCPWNFPGKNTGVGFQALLQGTFLMQGSNMRVLDLHWKVGSLPLAPPGKPMTLKTEISVSQHSPVKTWDLKSYSAAFMTVPSLPGNQISLGENDSQKHHSKKSYIYRRRKWQPPTVLLPGESQGRRSLVGCHLWGRRVGHDWSDLTAAYIYIYIYLG